jgi:hypothetical protein
MEKRHCLGKVNNNTKCLTKKGSSRFDGLVPEAASHEEEVDDHE